MQPLPLPFQQLKPINQQKNQINPEEEGQTKRNKTSFFLILIFGAPINLSTWDSAILSSYVTRHLLSLLFCMDVVASN